MPKKIGDSRPGEKLLSLYTLLMLRGNHPISLIELSQLLECSKQTVLRLLDQLESSGYGKLDIPIVKDRQHYYRMVQYGNKNLTFGIEELSQIALCRNMLLRTLPKGIGALFGKKEEAAHIDTGEINKGETKNVGVVFTKGYIDYSEYQDQYTQLLQSIYSNRVCEVTYRHKLPEKRRTFYFAPKRLVIYRENIIFVGWEVNDSGEVKQVYDNYLYLYLQRFISARRTKRASENLPDPKLAQTGEGEGAFGTIVNKMFHAKIEFNPEASDYIYDRKWSTNQKYEILSDGTLILDIDVQNEAEFISWILSFGHKAKVLEPSWLRENIGQEIQLLTNMYK